LPCIGLLYWSDIWNITTVPTTFNSATHNWYNFTNFLKNKKNNMSEKEFLQWIYDRLVNIHKENPHMDYMWKFKELIDKKK
jgi:hypothetical protein